MSVCPQTLVITDKYPSHRLWGLALVILLAILPRAYAIAHTEVIQRDGVTFIRYARALESSSFSSVSAFDQHPGYPLLLATAHRLVYGASTAPETWEHTGQAISLVMGVLATVGVWALSGLAVNWRVAWVAGGLFAIGRKWSMLGADVMSDATMLCFWVWSLVLVVLAAQRSLQSPSSSPIAAGGLAAAAGALSGLAYMVRPEGAGAALIGVALFAILAFFRRLPLFRAVALAATLALAAILAALPYAWMIGGLTKKKDLVPLVPTTALPTDTLLPLAQLRGPAADFAPPMALWAQTIEALNPVIAGLVAFFLLSAIVHYALPLRYRKPFLAVPSGPGGLVLLLVVLLYVPLLLRLHVRAGYLDWRHCMSLAFALVPLAGCGLIALTDALATVASPLRLKSLTVRQFIICQWLWVYPLTLVGAGWLSFRPLHAGNSYVFTAAAQLRADAQSHPAPYLITNLSWLLHYAHLPGQILDSSTTDAPTYAARLAAASPRPTHIVLSERWLAPGTNIPSLIPPDFTLLATIRQEDDTNDTLWLFHRPPPIP